jgi:hypothetical protein
MEMLQRVLCLKKSAGRSIESKALFNASMLESGIQGSDFSSADDFENQPIF